MDDLINKALIDRSIKILTEQIKDGISPESALKYTQAALNLAHTKATLDLVKKKD